MLLNEKYCNTILHKSLFLTCDIKFLSSCMMSHSRHKYAQFQAVNIIGNTVLDLLSGKTGIQGFSIFRIFWILDLYAEEF
jgi:hypothetical protein